MERKRVTFFGSWLMILGLLMALSVAACEASKDSEPKAVEQAGPTLAEGAALADKLAATLRLPVIATDNKVADQTGLRLLISPTTINLDSASWAQSLDPDAQALLLKRSKGKIAELYTVATLENGRVPLDNPKAKREGLATLTKRLERIYRWVTKSGKQPDATVPALHVLIDKEIGLDVLEPVMEAVRKAAWKEVYWVAQNGKMNRLVPTALMQRGRLTDHTCPNAVFTVQADRVNMEIARPFMNVLRYGTAKPRWRLQPIPPLAVQKIMAERGKPWTPDPNNGAPPQRPDLPEFLTRIFGQDDVTATLPLTAVTPRPELADLEALGALMQQEAPRCADVRFRAVKGLPLQTLVEVMAAASAKSGDAVMLLDINWLLTEPPAAPVAPAAPAVDQAQPDTPEQAPAPTTEQTPTPAPMPEAVAP